MGESLQTNERSSIAVRSDDDKARRVPIGRIGGSRRAAHARRELYRDAGATYLARTAMPSTAPFYYRITENIRITVRPKFLPEQSIPEQRQYVFEYNVRIENTGQQSVQLLSRRWRIHDSVGEDTVVAGDGVIGEQPLLVPGAVHQYQSFCVLKSANGHMEGEYRFVRADATNFEASIPRFTLTADEWQGTSS